MKNISLYPSMVSFHKSHITGSLSGHALPGSIFIIFGLWWYFNFIILLCNGQEQYLRRLLNWTWFPIWFCKGRASCLPLEPFFIIFAVLVGCIGEWKNGGWSLVSASGAFIPDSVPNFSHFVMYLAFGVKGVVDLLLKVKTLGSLFGCLGHIALGIAYTIEGVLFYFHLDHERSAMNVRCHVILYYTIFLCAVSTFLEAWNRPSITFAAIRIYGTILQGTWFWHIALTLYGPIAWEKDEPGVMAIAVVFCCHVLGLLVFMVGLMMLLKILMQFGYLTFCTVQSSVESDEIIPLTTDYDENVEV